MNTSIQTGRRVAAACACKRLKVTPRGSRLGGSNEVSFQRSAGLEEKYSHDALLVRFAGL